jgi:hypothetical protein
VLKLIKEAIKHLSRDYLSRLYVDIIYNINIYIIKLGPPNNKPRLYLNLIENKLGISEVS